MIPNINEASIDTTVLCLEYEKVKSYSDFVFKFEKKLTNLFGWILLSDPQHQ